MALVLKSLLAALGAATVHAWPHPHLPIHTKVVATNLCGDDCTMRDVVLDFPESAEGIFPEFDFAIRAKMTKDMSFGWRYHVTADLGDRVHIMAWNGTGVPCGFTEVGDSVAFKLHMGLPECHATAGPIEVKGGVKLHLTAAPHVPINVYFNMWDADGSQAIKLHVRLHHGVFAASEVESRSTKALALPGSHLVQPLFSMQKRTTITSKNCCDEDCLMKNVTLNFPDHYHGFWFGFNVTGQFEHSITDLRYGLHAVMKVLNTPLPLTILVGNGSLCGDTTTGDHMEFKLALNPGTCPVPAGEYTLNGWTRFTAPLDVLGNLDLRVEVTTEEGSRVGCADVNLAFGEDSTNNLVNV